MRRVIGMCETCVRFHPKAEGNCEIAKEIEVLRKKYKCSMLLTDCPKFLSPTEVFPIPCRHLASEGGACDGFLRRGACDCPGGDVK